MKQHKRMLCSWLVVILLATYVDAQCSSNGQTVLSEDLVQPVGTITFDDIGLSGTWQSGPTKTLVDASGQTITLNGIECIIYAGQYVMGPGTWIGSSDWATGDGTPGYFLAVNSPAGYCRLEFNPPIYQVSMRISASPTSGQLYISDDADQQISCTEIFPNSGTNTFVVSGFASSTPITYLYLSTNYMTADNIAWSYCPVGIEYDGSSCVDPPIDAPIEAPVDAPLAAPVVTPTAAPIASPIAATEPVKAPIGQTSFAATSVSISGAISVACLVLALAW